LQGSTGKPKCIVHSHNGMANELLLATAEKDMGVSFFTGCY